MSAGESGDEAGALSKLDIQLQFNLEVVVLEVRGLKCLAPNKIVYCTMEVEGCQKLQTGQAEASRPVYALLYFLYAYTTRSRSHRIPRIPWHSAFDPLSHDLTDAARRRVSRVEEKRVARSNILLPHLLLSSLPFRLVSSRLLGAARGGAGRRSRSAPRDDTRLETREIEKLCLEPKLLTTTTLDSG